MKWSSPLEASSTLRREIILAETRRSRTRRYFISDTHTTFRNDHCASHSLALSPLDPEKNEKKTVNCFCWICIHRRAILDTKIRAEVPSDTHAQTTRPTWKFTRGILISRLTRERAVARHVVSAWQTRLSPIIFSIATYRFSPIRRARCNEHVKKKCDISIDLIARRKDSGCRCDVR